MENGRVFKVRLLLPCLPLRIFDGIGTLNDCELSATDSDGYAIKLPPKTVLHLSSDLEMGGELGDITVYGKFKPSGWNATWKDNAIHPATRWDAFKWRFFPAWAIRRWPARYVMGAVHYYAIYQTSSFDGITAGWREVNPAA